MLTTEPVSILAKTLSSNPTCQPSRPKQLRSHSSHHHGQGALMAVGSRQQSSPVTAADKWDHSNSLSHQVSCTCRICSAHMCVLLPCETSVETRWTKPVHSAMNETSKQVGETHCCLLSSRWSVTLTASSQRLAALGVRRMRGWELHSSTAAPQVQQVTAWCFLARISF